MTSKHKIAGLLLAVLMLFSADIHAQDLTSGRAVLEANIEATGGKAAWNAVQDMYAEASIEAATPMGAITIGLKTWSIFPGYGLTQITLDDGPDGISPEMVEMKAYYTPLEGWFESASGRQDLASAAPQMKRQFMRSSPKSELEMIGYADSLLVLYPDSTFGDKPVYVVGVTADGTETKMLFDKSSLLVLAQETQTPVGVQTTVMGEYMEVNGLLFASGQTVESAQGTQSVTFSKIEIDTGVTPAQLASKSGARATVGPE